MTHCHTLTAALRRRGYRVTPQREMIIEVIAHGGRHMTAEEVHTAVHDRAPAVNIATVYRVLDLLVAQGLASRTDLGDGRLAYATCRHGPHVHLVCRQCGHTVEASEALLVPLGDHIRSEYGFAADLQHLSLFGLCGDCAAVEHDHDASAGQ